MAKVDSSLPDVDDVEVLNIGTPSMTNNAELLARSTDDSPLNVTRIDPPGPEFVLSMARPATLPASPPTQLEDVAALEKFPPSTLVAAYPSDFSSLFMPNAVTTTDSRTCASSIILTLISDLLPTLTVSSL